MSRYGKEAKKPFKWTKGSFDETAKYKWNTKQATWHFCPKCSSFLLGTAPGGVLVVNVRTFDDFKKFDWEKIKIKEVDGAKLVPGVPPAKQKQPEGI